MRKSSGGWYSLHCPFCDLGREKWKCAVRFDWQMVKCWECGYREKIILFVADMENLTTYQAREMLAHLEQGSIDLGTLGDMRVSRTSEILLPEGYVGILEGSGHHADLARNYLTNRGFDLTDLDRLGVGYSLTRTESGEDNYFGYIIIPFIRRGLLYYYIARTFLGYEPKYRNPNAERLGVLKSTLLYNEDALDMRKLVFVNEGVLDAWMYGKYGVATLGWSWSKEQVNKLLTSNCKRIVVVPDAGFYKEAIQSCIPLLGKKEIKVLQMDELAHLGKDTNEIGLEPIMKLYHRTPLLTFSHAVDAVNTF